MPNHRTIPRVCRTCSADFLASVSAVNAGKAIYCSPGCRATRRGRRIDRACERCDATFAAIPSKVRIGAGRFCSTHCARTAQWSTTRTPNYRPVGSTRTTVRGNRTYREIKVADPDVWDYEHRVVLAAKLERPLRSDEHVHHINHDGLDNRPENLKPLKLADHIREELGLNGRWSLLYDACVTCGETSSIHAAHGQCARCRMREQRRKASPE